MAKKGFTRFHTKTAGPTRSKAIQERPVCTPHRLKPLLLRSVRIMRTHRKRQTEERLLFSPDYEDHGLAFSQPNGRPLHPHNISARKFHRLCKKAGVKQIRFHDMRHTHASLLLARGVHPKVVAGRLEHSTVDLTLNTYSHVVESVERDVAKEV